jgi:hypothetical protein
MMVAFTLALFLFQQPTPTPSLAELTLFIRSHPCPATHSTEGPCPGYIVDYVTPLNKGGQDSAANMRWVEMSTAIKRDRRVTTQPLPRAKTKPKPRARHSSAAARSGYITGPRGGCYYINSHGNKEYVSRSLCH